MITQKQWDGLNDGDIIVSKSGIKRIILEKKFNGGSMVKIGDIGSLVWTCYNKSEVLKAYSMITEPEHTKQYKKKMFKITELYRIDVQYYNADLSAQVRLMNDQCTRFIFSPELRKLFEKEMNKAINKLKNENL